MSRTEFGVERYDNSARFIPESSLATQGTTLSELSSPLTLAIITSLIHFPRGIHVTVSSYRLIRPCDYANVSAIFHPSLKAVSYSCLAPIRAGKALGWILIWAGLKRDFAADCDQNSVCRSGSRCMFQGANNACAEHASRPHLSHRLRHRARASHSFRIVLSSSCLSPPSTRCLVRFPRQLGPR